MFASPARYVLLTSLLTIAGASVARATTPGTQPAPSDGTAPAGTSASVPPSVTVPDSPPVSTPVTDKAGKAPEALIVVGDAAFPLCPLVDAPAVAELLGGGPVSLVPMALYEVRAALGPVGMDFHQEGAVDCSAVSSKSLARRVTLRVTTDAQLKLSGGQRTTSESLFNILKLKETPIDGKTVPVVSVKRSDAEVTVAGFANGVLVEASARCEDTCTSAEKAADRAALVELVTSSLATIPTLSGGVRFTLPAWEPAESRVTTSVGSVDLCAIPGSLIEAAAGVPVDQLDPATAVAGTDFKGNWIQGCQWLPKANLASVTPTSAVGVRVLLYERATEPSAMSIPTNDLTAPAPAALPKATINASATTIMVPTDKFWLVVQRLPLTAQAGPAADHVSPIAVAVSAVL